MKRSWAKFLNFISYFSLSFPPKHKNISYLSREQPQYNKHRHILDIYTPKGSTERSAVVIFIHGGKWQVGNKNSYRFLGKNLANKNVVAVIINYRLFPQSSGYEDMSMDCAQAVKWVYENIGNYGGDKNRIFLYGHSSGAHLCALITGNNRFFNAINFNNPVKGVVLLDAFGLTIDHYLKHPEEEDKWMYKIFTNSPEIWKDAAPVNFILNDPFKILLLSGGKSPLKIQEDAELFFKQASTKKKSISLTKLNDIGHLGMVFQLYYSRHPLYKDFINFMNS